MKIKDHEYLPEKNFRVPGFKEEAIDNAERARHAKYHGINPQIDGKQGVAWFADTLTYIFHPENTPINCATCYRVNVSSLEFERD